jgi:hypothetical protein
MDEEAAKFILVAAAVVAIFAFMSVAAWVNARAEERKARDRYALLRKISEQPPEAAERVLAILKEDEARQDARRRTAAKNKRRNDVQAGFILIALGFGISIFLNSVAPDSNAWTLGIMILLVGVVLAGFALFAPETRE